MRADMTKSIRGLLSEHGFEFSCRETEYADITDVDDILPIYTMGGTVYMILHPEDAVKVSACLCGKEPIIDDNLNESCGAGDAWASCGECGYLLCVLTDKNSEMPNYCPKCGTKVKNNS